MTNVMLNHLAVVWVFLASYLADSFFPLFFARRQSQRNSLIHSIKMTRLERTAIPLSKSHEAYLSYNALSGGKKKRDFTSKDARNSL
jgi:hypothetical protein